MADEIKLPEWLNPGIEPPQRIKQSGWGPGEKPAAQYMNWQMHQTYQSLVYFRDSQQQMESSFSEQLAQTNDFAQNDKETFAYPLVNKKVITLFDNPSELTKSNSGVIELSTNCRYGKQACRMMLDATNGYVYAEKGVNLDLTNAGIYLDVYVDNPASISNIGFYIYVTASKYVYRSFNASYLKKGHNTISFVPKTMQKTGFTNDAELVNVTKVRIVLNAPTSSTSHIVIDRLWTATNTLDKPKISITFDDGHSSVYELAKPAMDKYGFKGVAYINTNHIENGVAARMTLAQLKILEANGWDVSPHTHNHIKFLTEARNMEQIEYELRECKAWLLKHGFKNGVGHFATAGGEYNYEILELIKKYCISHRGTVEMDDYYPANPWELKTRMIRNTTTLEEFKKWVDDAVKSKTWLILTYHYVNDPAEVGTQVTPAFFEANMEYLASVDADIVTLSDMEKRTGDIAKATATVEETKQLDFLTMQQTYTLDKTRANLWRKRGSRNVEFLFPTTNYEYLFYRFEKDVNDDFLKMREMSIYHKPVTKSNYTVVTGSMAGTASLNHYTTSVGTKITQTITGRDIDFLHYFSDVGGVWKVTIDNVEVGNFSTHTKAIKEEEKEIHFAYLLARRKLARNLTDTSHTVTLEFMGADTNNPPSTGSARGWITSNENLPNIDVCSFYSATGIVKKQDIINDASNKEFALNLKDTSNNQTNWIPEHNSVGTLFVYTTGLVQILVDGRNVNDFTTTEFMEFKEASIVQQLFGRISTDTTNRVNVFMNTRIADGVVKLKTKLEFTRNTNIQVGYVNMLPVSTGFCDTITTAKGKNQEITKVDDSFTELEEHEPSKDFVATKVGSEYFAGVRIDDDTMAMVKNTRIQHRAAIQKMYPVVFNNTDVVSGQSFTFGGAYYIGKMALAHRLIKP